MLEKLMKQAIMNRVLYALLPVIIFSIYLFGWRVLAIVIISNFAAYITEYLFVRTKKNGKVSMAVFVTGTLLALTLPPTIPFWMAVVGSGVAIMFGKMVYGGFGMNVFNPAIVGRTFIYISFPQEMTVNWIKNFGMSDFPGGFVHWMGFSGMQTSATILGEVRNSGTTDYTFMDAFLGFIPGSIGETSALIILLAGLYLIVTKTAKWQPMVATTLSLLICNWLFYPGQNPLFNLVTGGAMFGIVYMVTDPVSQAKGKLAIWIYGTMIGFLTVFIRKFSLFYEGMMFAILLTNAFMPMIEYGLDKLIPLKPKGAAA